MKNSVRYGRAGYGFSAAIRWYIGKAIWFLRGRPYPGITPIGKP